MQPHRRPPWFNLIALFLVGAVLQFLLDGFLPRPVGAQGPPAVARSCSQLTVALTAEEQTYARNAWQYFLNNYQAATGLPNATGGYPASTLWDIGNYLMALNTARWLNLSSQADFDARLNQFLSTLSGLKLFEDALPNKAYSAATGKMVDYGNNPTERGIGWSALDLGRLLAALHVIRTCHPQYNDWIQGVVSKWQIGRSLRQGQLFGATVLPDKSTLLVQEGRLGYEEYAARGYELWGFKAAKALDLKPFKFVEVNGVQIPVDTRDYQSTNANNYVVSESYILDGIEFGLQGDLAEFAQRVLAAQRQRYESTGQLTAVSEDNIDQGPYFLYNTVYANGTAWATITDENKPYPQFRTISTKAAFGWHYLYPQDAYAQKVFDVVKDLRAADGGGFYAGLYEETKQPNKALTGNTNGLILEILFYKARGNRPLIDAKGITFSQGSSGTALPGATLPGTTLPTVAGTSTSSPPPSTPLASPPSPAPQPSIPPPTVPPQRAATAMVIAPTVSSTTVAPIPAVDAASPSICSVGLQPLSVPQKRYATAAWSYFQANYQPKTGLVNDRSDLQGATLWGLGDYLAALHAAQALNIISAPEFDRRTRYLLGALGKLPLFGGELPGRGYNIQTLQLIDYGGNPLPEGNGWSSLDVGRFLAALHNLKTCHPEYTTAVDQVVLDWSYLRVVRDGRIASAVITQDRNGRTVPSINPETRLGYEEYAARAFQLWGFEVDRSATGGEYQTANVEGFTIPIQRHRPSANPSPNQYTISNPFVLYGLEFGFDPQMRSLVQSMFQAQAERYRRTGMLTAAATSLIEQKPYVVHSSLIGQGEPWATLTDAGQSVPERRIVSTPIAFAYQSLFPEQDYARQLQAAVLDLYNPLLGYYEGFYEKTGKTVTAFSGSTNSLILQSLLYQAMNQQPLIHPATASNSPWWQAIAAGDSGRGLPNTASPKAQLIAQQPSSYWTSANQPASSSVVK